LLKIGQVHSRRPRFDLTRPIGFWLLLLLLHRFTAPPQACQDSIELKREPFDQLVRLLKLAPGDRVLLCGLLPRRMDSLLSPFSQRLAHWLRQGERLTGRHRKRREPAERYCRFFQGEQGTRRTHRWVDSRTRASRRDPPKRIGRRLSMRPGRWLVWLRFTLGLLVSLWCSTPLRSPSIPFWSPLSKPPSSISASWISAVFNASFVSILGSRFHFVSRLPFFSLAHPQLFPTSCYLWLLAMSMSRSGTLART